MNETLIAALVSLLVSLLTHAAEKLKEEEKGSGF
jgi:hypothetical protein